MTLSPADYATLNAAVADLRAWDARVALRTRAGALRRSKPTERAGRGKRAA